LIERIKTTIRIKKLKKQTEDEMLESIVVKTREKIGVLDKLDPVSQ
jgi:hypothetical protein